MKRFRDWRTALLPAFVLAMTLIAANANADFTFGEPVNLVSASPVFDPAHDWVYCFSSDKLEMYIFSDRTGGYGDYDLWALRRASIDEEWGPAENFGATVNSPKGDAFPWISADGLSLCFESLRAGGYGDWDLYVTTRASVFDAWGVPVNLGPKVNSSDGDAHPWMTPDGLEIYFVSFRAGGRGDGDIYVTRRATTNDPWGQAVNLGSMVNSSSWDGDARLSPDGLTLFFCSQRPGGFGIADEWMTRRPSNDGVWGPPINFGPSFNAAYSPEVIGFSPDGSSVLFWADLPGVWEAPILPVVDFNADGAIDLADLVMLINNWGTNNTLCDIGPFAWGDGKVDIEDLKVFIAYWEKENPRPPAKDSN